MYTFQHRCILFFTSFCSHTPNPAPHLFQTHGIYPNVFEFTSVREEKYTDGVELVSLRNTIGVAQIVLQTKRIKVASALDLAETLISDLQAFDPKLIDRNLRGGRNADLVFALAIALWWGDKLTWTERADQRYDRKPKRHRSHWSA